MKLSDHLPKFACKQLKHDLGITTVEEALNLTDDQLKRSKGVGNMFCYHLRQLETKIPPGERVENTQIHTHMFILRRLLGPEMVESNTVLGESYNIIFRATNPDSFQRAFDAFYGPRTEQAGVKHFVDERDVEVVAFIHYQDGSRTLPLYKGQVSYIMTDSGSTFSGRLTMRDGDADVPTSR